MQIEVVSVSVEDKGKYKVATVAYRSNGKLQEKKLFSFGDQAKAYEKLKDAKQGETYEIVAKKNDKGYWDWVDFGSSDGTPFIGSKPAASGGGNTTPSRSFETPEERALRQKLIVRQSSITAALELAKVNTPKGGISPQQVVEIAQFFDDWVWSRSAKPETTSSSIADLEDDVPL